MSGTVEFWPQCERRVLCSAWLAFVRDFAQERLPPEESTLLRASRGPEPWLFVTEPRLPSMIAHIPHESKGLVLPFGLWR